MSGEWFTTPDGKVRLSGWEITAAGGQGSPWFGLASCPRCGALASDNSERSPSAQMLRHEEWHANTDYPRP